MSRAVAAVRFALVRVIEHVPCASRGFHVLAQVICQAEASAALFRALVDSVVVVVMAATFWWCRWRSSYRQGLPSHAGSDRAAGTACIAYRQDSLLVGALGHPYACHSGRRYAIDIPSLDNTSWPGAMFAETCQMCGEDHNRASSLPARLLAVLGACRHRIGDGFAVCVWTSTHTLPIPYPHPDACGDSRRV